MQLHSTGTDPTRDAKLVCRNARFGLLILLAMFWGATGLWWWLEAPQFIVYACGAISLFLTPFLFGSWRRRGRAENWVLALHETGLWINLRDCEYLEFEPGETILFVPYDEIVSAQKVVHRYTTPGSDGGDVRRKDIYLDLQLSSRETSAIRDAMKSERRRGPAMTEYFGGLIRVGQKSIKRMPIEIMDDDILRLKFTSGNFGLQPRLDKVLAELRNYVCVDQADVQGDQRWQDLDEVEFDKLIYQMVLDGHDIEANKLLRHKRKMSTTEAHEFINELRKQLSK